MRTRSFRTPPSPVLAPTWAGEADSLVVDGRDTGVRTWVARSRAERRMGLLGTDGVDGAVWLTRCRSVHCVGMRHVIDVVYVSGTGEVLTVRTMRPGSIGAPRLRARSTVEMAQGQATELGIVRGSHLALAGA